MNNLQDVSVEIPTQWLTVRPVLERLLAEAARRLPADSVRWPDTNLTFEEAMNGVLAGPG